MAIVRTINISKTYHLRSFFRRHSVVALKDVTVEVPEDSIVAVVGESGSGKSTLARMLLGLERPDSGKVLFKGQPLEEFDKAQWKVFRRSVSVVFQDPFASLNPRMDVYSILSEPLKVHRVCKGSELKERVVSLLKAVDLSEEHLNRYPHEFSGGQRQRLCIARALALEPELLVADEPLSALDVSVQAQIVNLLQKLKSRNRLSILLVSHDLELVRYLAEYVYIMFQGRVVEEAPGDVLFDEPLHPYTRVLLDSVPRIRAERLKRRQHPQVDDNGTENRGCAFYGRCPEKMPVCAEQEPELKDLKDRKVACFR
ncbi:MAG: ATP-binding cassette domain-containing protein, partial [Nitrospirae bacterium]